MRVFQTKDDSKLYLRPNLYEIESGTKFQPLSLFDRMLKSQHPFVETASVFENSPAAKGPWIKNIDWVESNATLFDAAQKLYEWVQTSHIYLQSSPSTPKLRLNTPGGDFTHLHQSLANGPEFVMTSVYAQGKSLKKQMEERNVESVIGPMVLQVLEAFGYATRSSPRNFTLVDVSALD